MNSRALICWLAVSVLIACAPDLRTDFPFDGESHTGPKVVVSGPDGGEKLATIDATNKGAWVYFDLDAEKELSVEEALSTSAWDLAFRRVDIMSNGGASNPDGRVKVAAQSGGYEGLTMAPETGYLQDGEKTVFNGALGGWYIYDLTNHGVSPGPAVYVIDSTEAKFYKLQITRYYDEAGTSGNYTLKFQQIAAPRVMP